MTRPRRPQPRFLRQCRSSASKDRARICQGSPIERAPDVLEVTRNGSGPSSAQRWGIDRRQRPLGEPRGARQGNDFPESEPAEGDESPGDRRAIREGRRRSARPRAPAPSAGRRGRGGDRARDRRARGRARAEGLAATTVRHGRRPRALDRRRLVTQGPHPPARVDVSEVGAGLGASARGEAQHSAAACVHHAGVRGGLAEAIPATRGGNRVQNRGPVRPTPDLDRPQECAIGRRAPGSRRAQGWSAQEGRGGSLG